MTTAQGTATVEITAIRMTPGGTRHEHIEQVRWRNVTSGKTDSSTVSTMVGWIDRGGRAAVGSGQARARVVVVRPSNHAPYLRTVADGVPTNNLLHLPRF